MTKIANRLFENVAQHKYLRTSVINQNLEIKGRSNSGNGCYHSIQNLLSFHVLSKNSTIRICKTIILCGCETLRKGHRLRVFGLKRDEVIGGWRKVHNEELHNLYSSLSM
jgi:hypothetical protein